MPRKTKPTTRRPHVAIPAVCLLLLSAVCIVYAPSLHGPFVYDDLPGVVLNPNVQNLWPLSVAADAPPNTPLTSRPITAITMAISYRWHQFDAGAFRAFNVVLHGLNAALLFLLAHRLILRSTLKRWALPTAALAALCWAVHPLNADAVAYITQRSKLLEGFFFLLMLWALDHQPESQRRDVRRTWSILAVSACLLGMASKESMFAAPLLALLYDRQFLAGSFKEVLTKRKFTHAALLSTWGLLAVVMVWGDRSGSVGMHLGIGGWEYLLTQTGVLLWYATRVIMPWGMAIHHEWPVAQSFQEVAAAFTLVSLAGAVTLVGLARRKWWGFVGAVAFGFLAPTSSFVPMTTEIVAERRVYLPLAGVMVMLAVAVTWTLRGIAAWGPKWQAPAPRRLATAMILLAMLGTAGMGFRRAHIFGDPQRLWTDVVTQYPYSAMGWNNLAAVHGGKGQRELADAYYRRAAACVETGFATPHINLGRSLFLRGRTDEALALLRLAEIKAPQNEAPFYFHGSILAELGQHDQAIDRLERALEIAPTAEVIVNRYRELMQKRNKPQTERPGGMASTPTP